MNQETVNQQLKKIEKLAKQTETIRSHLATRSFQGKDVQAMINQGWDKLVEIKKLATNVAHCWDCEMQEIYRSIEVKREDTIDSNSVHNYKRGYGDAVNGVGMLDTNPIYIKGYEAYLKMQHDSEVLALINLTGEGC